MNRHHTSRTFAPGALVGLGLLLGSCTNGLWFVAPPESEADAGAVFADAAPMGSAGAAGAAQGVADSGVDDAAPSNGTCPSGFRSTSGGCVFEEAAVAEAVRTFLQDGFVSINTQPFVQLFGPAKRRDVFVSDTSARRTDGSPTTAAELYAAIDPREPSFVLPGSFPMGTMLLHASVDEALIDVMVKRGPGYSPGENDWWFARYFEDGTAASTEPGPYGTCMDCHVMEGRASRTDLLWGVPREVLAR